MKTRFRVLFICGLIMVAVSALSLILSDLHKSFYFGGITTGIIFLALAARTKKQMDEGNDN